MKANAKILVVDDDRRMVRTLCDILDIKGYVTEMAYNGEAAVEKVLSTPPDCVLMDIRMPGINGIEALKIISRLKPGLPVLLMSAYVTEEQTEEAGIYGAHAVFHKPLDMQEILDFLSRLLKEDIADGGNNADQLS